MTRSVAWLAALAVALVLVELAGAASGHAPPGTFALSGVLGGAAIVAVSKLLGAGLQRRESDDDE